MKYIRSVAIATLLFTASCAVVENDEKTSTNEDETTTQTGEKFWDFITDPIETVTETVTDTVSSITDAIFGGDSDSGSDDNSGLPAVEDVFLLGPLLGEAIDLTELATDIVLDEIVLGIGMFGSEVLTAHDAYQYLVMNRKYVNAPSSGEQQPIPQENESHVLPESFDYEGEAINSEDFLDLTGSGSLIVTQKLDGEDTIVFEDYYNGQNAGSQFESWSVMKSITATMIGLAVEDGYISSVNDYARDYLSYIGPESAYYDVRIVDLLEMASGIEFTEDYTTPTADIALMQATLSNPFKGFKDHAQRYTEKQKDPNGNDYAPGTFRKYKSMDSQLLGLILDTALGDNYSYESYMETRLWQPTGMTSDAYLLADKDGMPATYAGCRATSRDYTKIGLLYLNDGLAQNGQRVLPAELVADNVRADKPHLQVNGDAAYKDDATDWWGYGRQWWISDTDENFDSNEFMAIGVLNQFIYVNKDENIVIVKNSGNPTYMLADVEYEHLAFFRAIVENIKQDEPDDDNDHPSEPPEPTEPAAQNVSFLSAHGRYFVSEGNGGYTVNANRTSAGSWETFTIETTDNAECIKNGQTVSVRTSSGYYWSAQPNGDLNSDRNAVGDWEKFKITNHSDATGCMNQNHSISLQSVAHQKYVVAEFWGGAYANRGGIGAWEKMSIQLH